MAARAGYNSLCAMCNAAPRALAPSHVTRVSGLLRSAKSTSSASEYDFVASIASRETRKAFASSRTSCSTGKCQERSGEGGTLCPKAILQIAAVTIRKTSHRQVVFITLTLPMYGPVRNASIARWIALSNPFSSASLPPSITSILRIGIELSFGRQRVTVRD